MGSLYQNESGDRVYVIARHAQFHNGIGDTSVVVYRGLDVIKTGVDVRVMPHAAFDVLFKHVEWKGNVDLYALLHEHLGKDQAYEIACELEAALEDEVVPDPKKLDLSMYPEEDREPIVMLIASLGSRDVVSYAAKLVVAEARIAELLDPDPEDEL